MKLEAAAPQLDAEVVASVQQIEQFLGTKNVKIVFQNISGVIGYLYYIDIAAATGGTPAIVPMDNTQGAILPMISPDGNYVVYGKGPGGDLTPSQEVKSNAYICAIEQTAQPTPVKTDFAHEPRFMFSDEITVIYSTLGSWGAWNGIGQVMAMKTPGGIPSGTETPLVTSGSYYGGLSKGGGYICSGGDKAVILDIHSGATEADTALKYGLKERNNPAAQYSFAPRQACNPSISSSAVRPDAMLCLDFGSYMEINGQTKLGINDSINGGTPWDIHDILMICGIEGRVLKHYGKPTAEEAGLETSQQNYSSHSWDDPEWSNHPYYAIANLEVERYYLNPATQLYDAEERHEKIYLVNLKDSTYLELVRSTNVVQGSSTNLQWPFLWIEMQTSFQEDSSFLNPTINTIMPIGTRSRPESGISVSARRIASTAPLQAVSLFTLQGKRLFLDRLSNTVYTYSLSRLTGNLSAGNYFLRVKSDTGRENVFNLIVE
jgi:hypothetical protein